MGGSHRTPQQVYSKVLLLMLPISVLPVCIIQQAADSILQLRLLTKDLLQALKYALLACLRCEQSLYQMGGGLNL